MTDAFDRDSWERRWSLALGSDRAADHLRSPNAHLRAAVEDLRPGLALDAGAGNGAEAIWLAGRGWRVTAVDFSATALESGRAAAERLGAEVASRVEWVEADLASWSPPPERFDLVNCLYVHVAGSVTELVYRLAAGVAPGGILLVAGHRPVDPATGAATPAAGQTQVSVEEARAALDPGSWKIRVAEERPRERAGEGVDALVVASRGRC